MITQFRFLMNILAISFSEEITENNKLTYIILVK